MLTGVASLAAVGFPPEVLAQFAAVAALGGGVGTIIGRRITAIELPQMVAALHSVVGLAAVMTSIASVLADLSHATTLHLVTAYLGVLIGKIFATLGWGVVNSPRARRWNHFHWLSSCVPQARWPHVIPSDHAPCEALRELVAFGY